MTYSIESLIGLVRKAIDEVAYDASEDFSTDLNAEIRQAIILAAQRMKRQLGRQFLEPIVATEVTISGTDTGAVGAVTLPDDFGDIIELQLQGWMQPVVELIESGTKEAMLQLHPWTMGTPEKPRAMMTLNSTGKNVIQYYRAPKLEGKYVHKLHHFHYLPVIDDSTESLPIVDNMYDILIYQAAALVLAGKGETQLAEQMASIGKIGDLSEQTQNE